MTPQHKRQLSLPLTSMGATLLAVATAMAAEPASRPANAPKSAPAVDQHGPTIKDAYKNHFLIGMAGDLRLLYQGRDPSIRANYSMLPYRLGLLKLDQSRP